MRLFKIVLFIKIIIIAMPLSEFSAVYFTAFTILGASALHVQLKSGILLGHGDT
jgi:hypothetical protein